MRFKAEEKEESILSIGIYFVITVTLLLMIAVLSNYKADIEEKSSKIESEIRETKLYKVLSYDYIRRFNLENRKLFDKIAQNAIRIHQISTLNSYNDRIIEEFIEDKKELEKAYNQAYKKELVYISTIPGANDHKKSFIIDVIEDKESIGFDDNKEFKTKMGTYPWANITPSIYAVRFCFPIYFCHVYETPGDLVRRGYIIDLYWEVGENC